jgi:AcrR family transcriptional regulator
MSRAVMIAGRRVAPPLGPGRYDRNRPLGERQREQKERLLLAAADVFGREGYANASVAKIIERAGVGRQTFYDHFGNVEEVLFELHDYAAARARKAVERAVAEVAAPADRLRAGLSAWLGCLAQDAPFARVAFRQLRAAGREGEARIERAVERWVEVLRRGAAEAHRQEIIRSVPDELTLYALASAILAVGERFLARREETRIQEAVPVLLDLVARVLR